MEYVEARTSRSVFRQHDPVLTGERGADPHRHGTGLEHVHDSGFMHLDFKPENILVTRNAGVRLVDFDLAQPIPEKPIKLSKNPGTPAYMAPEQLQQRSVRSARDIFAFGATAYELLTAPKPFPGDTTEDILRKQS